MGKNFGMILAADIGGTTSRFALFESEGPRLVVERELATHGFGSFRDLTEKALADLGPNQAQAAVLAVAGPVERGRSCRPPNIAYRLDLDGLPPGLLPDKAVLINDFAAQAHACRLHGEERSLEAVPGHMDASLTQAVIGPGTGLGKAALVPDGRGGYVVCGSEGGHAAFPFSGAEERRFHRFALEALGEPYVRWESVVSGPGLALTHRFLTEEDLSPSEAAAALTPDSLTTEWFSRFLGRACRDYVLEVLALGGLFISGGVAAKNPMLLKHPAFLAEFRLSATHADLLGKVAVRLVVDQHAGLWGAAAHGLTLLERTAAGA